MNKFKIQNSKLLNCFLHAFIANDINAIKGMLHDDGCYFGKYSKYMILKDEKKYEIKQIKSTRDLFLQGENLEHCVYSYTNYCEKGEVFIFSLRTKDENNNKISLLTIEVVEETIYQIKGKLNRLPNDFEMAIILGWAKEKELKYIT